MIDCPSNELAEQHASLPRKFVSVYLKTNPRMIPWRDDLLGEAALALAEAATTYENLGYSFQTYAWWQMRTAIKAFTRGLLSNINSRSVGGVAPDDVEPDEPSDPGDKLDAARLWEQVRNELQAIPIAVGLGRRARRPGEAEDFLRMSFGGAIGEDIASKLGVRQQTVAESMLRLRREFMERWPETASYFGDLKS